MTANNSAADRRGAFFAPGWFDRSVVRFGTLAGIAAVALVFSALSPAFRTFANGMNIVLQSMPLLMLSLAMTLVLIMRGVDLSIAYVADVAGLAAVALLIRGNDAAVCVAAALAIGVAIGLVNGLLVVNGVSALVATLGMMFIVKSLELMTTGGGNPLLLISVPRPRTRTFLFLGQGKIAGVPMQVLIGLCVLLLVYILIYHTRVGRYMHAIGGNARVAFLSGIGVKAYFAAGFVLSGLLSACGGVMNATRTAMAQPEGNSYLLLDAFVASYIGSITFHKGRMNVLGTVAGVLFVSILSNGVTVLGLGVVYQYLFKGCLIFLAVALARAGAGRD